MTAAAGAGRATLVLALHFHQPVGNLQAVLQRAYERCYRPFLELFEACAPLKMALHYSGSLLEWLEVEHPEYLTRLAVLVRAGRLELLGGGFYEPILAVIPAQDRLAQIRWFAEYLRERFGQAPRGAWLAERVWEPQLAASLADAGVAYTILDEIHCLFAGLSRDRIHGYYLTEDEGKTVAIFPSDRTLRQLIPFQPPRRMIEYAREVAARIPEPVLVYADDGEKFGEWPGTFEWVHGQRWLQRWFDALRQEHGWLQSRFFSEVLQEQAPRGTLYFPTASYEEMLDWALPPEAGMALAGLRQALHRQDRHDAGYRRFLRGGFWRNFLTKYPEANHMHKKMLQVSRRLHALGTNGHVAAERRPLLAEAQRELFRGQCNCAYWHGVFGGLYLYHLRQAVYHHLTRAEALADAVEGAGCNGPGVEIFDFDADGRAEAVVQDRGLAVYVDPEAGGVVTELDAKSHGWNVMAPLSRYLEVYHPQCAREVGNGGRTAWLAGGGEGGLSRATDGQPRAAYDAYRRASFIDHFLEVEATPAVLLDGTSAELGDFVGRPYEMVLAPGSGVRLGRTGSVAGQAVTITKHVRVASNDDGGVLTVEYEVGGLEALSRAVRFAVECHVTPPSGHRAQIVLGPVGDGGGRPASEPVEREQASSLMVRDEAGGLVVSLELSRVAAIGALPLCALTRSERGLERTYQSTMVVAHWAIQPHTPSPWRAVLTWTLKPLDEADAGVV